MKNLMLIILLFATGCSKNCIPKDLNECYVILNKKLSEASINEFRMLSENEALNSSHRGLGMWIRNNWGLWKSSELSRYFVELGMKHPDDISSVILASYHRHLNEKPILLEEQIEYYKKLYEGKTQLQLKQAVEIRNIGKVNLNWLSRNGIKLKDVKLNGRNEIYTCDSTMLLIHHSGDTINLWTEGIYGFMDTTQITRWITKEKYGIDNYIQGIGEEGRIEFMELKRNSFISRSDSLFEYVEMYTISNDSIQRIRDKANSLNDFQKTMSYLETNLYNNKIPLYKLIFHPKLFDENKAYDDNIQKDKIKLESKCLVDSLKYYSIRIENKRGKYNTSYAYIIDENHTFTKYEGCNREVLKNLNDEHRID